MSENFEHSIELIGGHTDNDDVRHTKVTFGRRLTAGDLMFIEDDPQTQYQTQHEALIRRRMITGFGSIGIPTLPMLLSLDKVDRQDLERAEDYFVRNSRGERTAEFLENDKVRLYFGFQIADVVYDIVQFGNPITGNDEVEADRLGLRGVRRTCFEIGRQIARLESSEHSLVLEGSVKLEYFEKLDMEDLGMLRLGGELATQSFRLRRTPFSGQRDGRGSVSPGEGDGMGGKPNSKSAKGKN